MSTRIVLERLPADPSGNIEYQAEQLKRHRVYIFPTIQGWIYSMMLIVMLLGAINYNNSMAYMLCFLLTSLGLVCMLHTYRNLSGLIISSSRPKSVFAGQPALFPIQLDNRLGLEKFSLYLEQQATRKKWFRKKETAELVSVGINSGQKNTSYYPVESHRRGVLNCKRLKISTTFPLGLFVAWSYFEPEYDCLIYPVPEGQKQLPVYTSNDDDTEYGTQAGTDDFAGFRKYRAGDPIHSIAWKAYAKEQGLIVKQFSGKGSKTLMLNWESVSHINNIEARLSQLCYWILNAEKASIHYALEIPGVSIEASHGNQHKEICLNALARYGN
ncbi:MAG: DUF58 domain-containing protein [Proteobacteria bacterium]|nr:DUF58 domain-containing protein [Pseudomonadota bacterium]NOG60581.1 DUF58 domain-containing protein [Pseudomonadota bacterium]